MIRKVDRIILLGTSHVGKDNVSDIEKVIEDYMPSVVGIELDARRFKSVMSENKDAKEVSSFDMIREIGAFGFLFAKVAGYIQKKVGTKVGVDPGVDMKSAYLKSRELKIPVALIDMDLRITMRKLSKVSFFKKMGIFFGLFFKSFKKEYRELLDFDLNKVPSDEVVSKMIGVLKKEVPVLYKILIHDRNVHMGNRLLKLLENHEGYVLAVVGAGHVEGMGEYLKEKLRTDVSHTISFSYVADVEEEGHLIKED